MLCQACNNVLSRKSARWKGSYKATFDSGDGGRQLTSTDSTTSEPEANSTDHPGLDGLDPEDIDTGSADYDYVLGYSLQDDPEGRVEWRYNGCYRPRTLNDTVKDRPIELQFKFFPSMGVFKCSSQSRYF